MAKHRRSSQRDGSKKNGGNRQNGISQRRQEEELPSDDELEAFNKRFTGDDAFSNLDANESEDSSHESAEEVLGEVNEEETSEEESEEEEGTNDDDRRLERISKDWGNRRSAFFKDDDHSNDEDDDESVDEEEEAEEAKRMKKQLLKGVTADDYGIDFSDNEDEVNTKKKKKRDSKKVDASLTDSQLERVVSQAPELLILLSELKTNLNTLDEQVTPLLNNALSNKFPMENGMSYLETKYQAMLTYCINITFYLYLRAKGESVRDHPVITELVRVRTLLEKLRPLDAKIKGQINQILSSSAGTNSDPTQNGVSSRPDASELLTDDDDSFESDSDNADAAEFSEDQDESGAAKRAATYKAPKNVVVASTFHEDERSDIRNAKRQAQRLRKVKRSELLQDIAGDIMEKPVEEPSVGSTMLDIKNRKLQSERKRYEEENYTRLQETKKEKSERRRREREAEFGLRNSLNELEDFGDLEGLISHVDRDASLRVDEKARREQELNKFMSKMAREEMNDSKKKRKMNISGDQDIKIRDPMDVRDNLLRMSMDKERKREEAAQSSTERKRQKKALREIEETTRVDTGEESAAYRDADADSKLRKAKRMEKFTIPDLPASAPVSMLKDGQTRKANYKILKNEGLHAHKKKEDRNPRVRKRKLYEKKLKARKGQVLSIRENEGETYSGEASGLRSNLVASRRPGISSK